MNDRLSHADTAWLHMDRPTNLMVITSVLLFDEPVDWDRVAEVVQRRLVDVYPRFHQRVAASRLPLRVPRWEDDPDFSLAHHLHHIALPAPGDRAALQSLVGDLMTMPLDHSRPLWHAYLIDGVGLGAAMVTRMHHCIADGIALAHVMLSLTDPDAQADESSRRDGPPARRGGLTRLVSTGERMVVTAGEVARAGVATARSPSRMRRALGTVARDGSTAVRLMFTAPDRPSALKGDPGLSRRVAWSDEISLARVKRIAHAHSATVNDVVLAAVTGALRRYLLERGEYTPEITAMVPFNLRPLDEPPPAELGNRFGLVFLSLPVGISGSLRRLSLVHRRMDAIKQGRDGAVSYELLTLMGFAPEPVERRVVDLFSGKGTAVMTNVPGPRRPVYLAGTEVRNVLIWAPTSGHIGMSVSVFSYRGQVTVGLMTDATLVPFPEDIVGGLDHELRELARKPARHTVQGVRPELAAHGAPPETAGGS